MPIKFKIYYFCALYVLVWSIGSAILLVCSLFLNDNSNIDYSAREALIFFTIMIIICIAKSIFALRAVRYFKREAMPAKAEKVIFIILFAFSIVFFLTDIGICIAMMADKTNNGFRPSGDSSADYLLKGIVTSFFVVCLCTLYMVIFDLILANAIKKKHYNSLLQLDIEMQEEA